MQQQNETREPGQSAGPDLTGTPEIVRALGVLLGRYVDLLDGGDHGGWTREEENLVRAVRSLLGRAGWTGALPQERSQRLHLNLSVRSEPECL